MSAYAKAIAAFVTPLVLTLLAPLGLGATTTLEDAIYLLITAIVTGLTVYFVPNRK